MSESNTPKSGGLWARLFSVQETPEELESKPEAHPAPSSATAPGATVAPTKGPSGTSDTSSDPDEYVPLVEEAPAIPAEATLAAEDILFEQETTAGIPAVAPAPQACMACGTPRKDHLTFCDDCGWMFPAPGDPATPAAQDLASTLDESDMVASSSPLKNRFELGGLIGERQGVRRHRGIDLTNGQSVVIVSAPSPALDLPVADVSSVATIVEDEIMPGFDEEIPMAAAVSMGSTLWPSIAWEKGLLDRANHPALPRVIDQFTANETEYLVLEIPVGQSLWDAWDEPHADASVRYTWLKEIAAGIEALHAAGALFEGIRPDVVVIDETSHARITDITNVLPLPLPANPPVCGTLYTAPELILSPSSADGRSDLYSFGALLYSLEYLHHPLEKKDFEREYTPLQITERFPDVHPMFLRLINKTFCRDVNTRFPTDEMTKSDPSGFKELIKTLDICRRSFDNVRLDISAWTTTGMVRTGNEDALTVLHGVDARLDDLHEYTMVLLCDGMGGYDAGEVAADMAINEMRKFLLQQPIFASLAGKEPPKEEVDPKKYQDVLRDALKHANREVFTASRTPGKGKRGMGCTAECVYIDSRNVIAGHVGDSRVYHLHRGRLIQLTRDQTLVNRLVELGQLTADEAENHPRKNELQQAIGGQPDVVPGVYSGKLVRGDWVLVCSDGLTNHISNSELEKMLTREAANSAEEAARRLLNLVNLRGATDNATIVVVRAS